MWDCGFEEGLVYAENDAKFTEQLYNIFKNNSLTLERLELEYEKMILDAINNNESEIISIGKPTLIVIDTKNRLYNILHGFGEQRVSIHSVMDKLSYDYNSKLY